MVPPHTKHFAIIECFPLFSHFLFHNLFSGTAFSINVMPWLFLKGFVISFLLPFFYIKTEKRFTFHSFVHHYNGTKNAA